MGRADVESVNSVLCSASFGIELGPRSTGTPLRVGCGSEGMSESTNHLQLSRGRGKETSEAAGAMLETIYAFLQWRCLVSKWASNTKSRDSEAFKTLDQRTRQPLT